MFALLLVVGVWPYRGLPALFSQVYCPPANALISASVFGRGGHARLVASARGERREEDSVTEDAVLALSVDGFAGEISLGLSLRRDVFLPYVILVAMLVSTPAAWAWRLSAIAACAPLVWITSVILYGLLAAWTFATKLRGIYALSPTGIRMADFAYGAILAPPGNRFIAPLALGLLIVSWKSRKFRRLA